MSVEFSYIEAFLNNNIATQAVLFQSALSTILGGEKARSTFNNSIKKLQNIE